MNKQIYISVYIWNNKSCDNMWLVVTGYICSRQIEPSLFFDFLTMTYDQKPETVFFFFFA